MPEQINNNGRLVERSYICDKCKIGVMLPTGLALLTNPPKYIHKCNSCGEVLNFLCTYPKIAYVEEQAKEDKNFSGDDRDRIYNKLSNAIRAFGGVLDDKLAKPEQKDGVLSDRPYTADLIRRGLF